MAKIDKSSRFPSQISFREQKKERTSGIFGGILEEHISSSTSSSPKDISDIRSDSELQSVIDSIHRLGDSLMKYPGLDTLTRYKQAIRDLIAYSVDHSYMLKEYLSHKDLINRKKYIIIKTIDEKLEKLTKNVLSSQKQQIDILSGLEEIKGLLIDIFHVH